MMHIIEISFQQYQFHPNLALGWEVMAILARVIVTAQLRLTG